MSQTPKIEKDILSIFFCSDCDNLLNRNAFRGKSSGNIICSDCKCKLDQKFNENIESSHKKNDFKERREFEEYESIIEISQCLKEIEKKLRSSRTKNSTENENKNENEKDNQKRTSPKKTINFDKTQKSFSERIICMNKVEENLSKYISLLEQQKAQSETLIQTIQERVMCLRESKEHWKQLELKLEENRNLYNKKFRKKVKEQFKNIEEKWEEREIEIKKRGKEIMNNMKKEVNQLSDLYLTKEEKEQKEKEHRKIIEKRRLIKERELWKDSSVISNKDDIDFLNKCLNESEIKFNQLSSQNEQQQQQQQEQHQDQDQVQAQQIEKRPQKLYQGSKEEFSSFKFHSKCDNQGKTIVLVKSSTGIIFGGFSNVSWDSSGKFKSDYERKSFLFNLNEKKKFSIIHLNLSINGGSGGHGPIFGSGFDLLLSDKCNINNNSYSILNSFHCNNYNGIVNSITFSSNRYFRVSEYEVWKVD